ncbi:hypothetical protein [Prauserella rugosa]|uniref:Cobyrinic acid a,c-diamide synthase n=1 Tax=Prauserella rugosa TaxID=43354 RepID=A0A660C8G4_9PSEU|nr:hypothetical protein [Prauserella rugosa]KMS92601.1 hypothetical protein ACZ91_03355 [Streptomyces regensis]TWH19828.1 hypothetical protein JD82_01661 [Prauserella rugosa]
MSRRASLPGASELFRRTSNPVFGDGAVTPAGPPAQTPAPDAESVESAAPQAGTDHAASEKDTGASGTSGASGSSSGASATGRALAKASAGRRGSGRQKHDTKITVYLSGDELVAIEQTRLALRASHDLAVDRGRIVREAVAVLLADFEDRGEDSVLVTRLRDGDLDGQEATN